MSKKLTNRQKQAIETKWRIRRSAAELMRDYDYEDITISEICSRANVSNGNFYHYFHSKEDLFLSAYATFDEFVEKEFVLRTFDSPSNAIRELIYEQVVGADFTPPSYQAQILRIQLRFQAESVTSPSRFFHRHLRHLVTLAIESGEIHDSYSIDGVTQHILRLSRGILFDWALRNGPYDVAEQTMRDLDILLQGLSHPPEYSNYKLEKSHLESCDLYQQ